MKAIKKQFVDFFNYFRLFNCGVNRNYDRSKLGGMVAGYVFYFIALTMIMSQTSNTINFFYGAMIGAVMGMCVTTSIKPSALSIAPFSPAQRVVFNFLCAFIYGLLFALIITLFAIAVMLLIALMIFIIIGENVFVIEAGATEAAEAAYSGYGTAYTVLLSVLVYFAVYALFSIKNKRAKIISCVSFLVLLEVFSLVMVNLFDRDLYTFYRFQLFAEVPLYIDRLAHPWIPILILSVATALAIAAAIFFSIRKCKSDKT